MAEMHLRWRDYRYFPYEREFARREVNALFGNGDLTENKDGISIITNEEITKADRLTYFAGASVSGSSIDTLQAKVENSAGNGNKRQSTRYSVHGLHEYKGKFNPQSARALLNIFGATEGKRVLDPFCGSGTTLVEATLAGATAVGTDVNPLAVYVANAKLEALHASSAELGAAFKALENFVECNADWDFKLDDTPSCQYLQSWFDESILKTTLRIKDAIEQHTGKLAPIFCAVASNLLREYSHQEPADLRIRRRKSSMPDIPFEQAFLSSALSLVDRIVSAQEVLGPVIGHGRALLCTAADLSLRDDLDHFDAAITSPPYAMALPYIDTQRLSLVWLGLIESAEIGPLEAGLVGSREMGVVTRRKFKLQMEDNAANLPSAQVEFCLQLQAALSSDDGFRRQAVPTLLYRYFSGMQAVMNGVQAVMKPNAPFGLIVGHNHTTLGGTRFDIDTPAHLAALAEHIGWHLEELLPLQAYQRFGLHAVNAVGAESLIVLKRS